MTIFHKTLSIHLLVLVGALLALVPSAYAGETKPLSAFGAFTNVQSIAVDQSTGDVYVYDAGEGGRIYRFNAQGEPAAFTKTGVNVIEGVGAGAGTVPVAGAGEEQIAVDSSTGPAAGDIYVANGSVVSIYASTGEHEGERVGELNSGEPEPWFKASGVTVDPAGNVYVSVWFNLLEKYTPTGPAGTIPTDAELVETRTIGLFPGNIAVNTTGVAYTQALSFGSGPAGRLAEYPAAKIIDPAVSAGLALSTLSGNIFSDQQTKIAQYNAAGSTAGLRTFGPLTGSYGVAINAAHGTVYAADAKGTTVDIFATTPMAGAPVVENEFSASVTSTSAELQATLSPHLASTTYYFQYGTNTAYTGGSVPDTTGLAIGEGEEGQPARVAISGLQPGTFYHYRVVATNDAGGTTQITDGADKTLTTSQPLPAPQPVQTQNPAAEAASTGAQPPQPTVYTDLTALKPIPAAKEPSQAKSRPKAKAKPCRKGLVKRHNKCIRKAKAKKTTHNQGSK